MVAAKLLMRAGKKADWTPHVLTRSVLRAWWNADDHGTARMTDDGSGLISSWKDRIGGMAVTAATTARPTWAASSMNGLAGVTGDGVANCMVSTSLSTLPAGATGGEIWLCVSVVTVSGAVQHLIRYGGSGSALDRSIYSGATGAFTVFDGTTSYATGKAALGNHIIGANWAGTTESARIDGVAYVGATIATLNTGTTRLRLFAADGTTAANFANITLRHVFITTTLADADRQRLEGWTAWDSGLTSLLPASHPYAGARP